MKIAINHVTIVTMTGEVIENGSLYIEEDRIAGVNILPKGFIADKTIDGKDGILLPGLVNAHSHAAMGLFRNYADDMKLKTWLEEKIWHIEDKLTAKDVYWGALLSIGEMIRSGVTAFADMYFFQEETARAVKESGIRANLCQGLISFTQGMEKIHDNIHLFKNYHDTCEGRLRISFGPHAPNTVEDDLFLEVVKYVKNLGSTIQVHLSESWEENQESMEKYGCSPTVRLNRLGVFDVPCLAAHGVYLDKKDMEILKEKKVCVAHNPSSNLKLASGTAPINELIKTGVEVALGTDGSASNNNQNLWEEMHLSSLIGKVQTMDPTAVNAHEVLKMATVNGAKALGFYESGTIEIGKKADIIIVSRDAFHHYPRFNIESELVYSTQASDVDTVIVNGKILMEGGILTTLDEEKIKFMAEKTAKKLAGYE